MKLLSLHHFRTLVLSVTGIIALMALTAIPFSSCGGGGGSSDGDSDDEMFAAFTDNTALGAMFANTDGEVLVAMTEVDGAGDLSAVIGAIYSSTDGATAVVFAGDDGNPERMIVGDYILLYSNYTDTTVDIALIYTPTGYIEVFRGVELNDISGALALRVDAQDIQAFTCFPTCEPDSKNLSEIIKLAGGMVGVSLCGAAILGSGGLALPCAGALFFTATQLTGEESFVNSGAGVAGTVLNAYGCVSSPVTESGRCLGLLIDVTATDVDLAADLLSDNSTAVDTASVFADSSEPAGVVAQGGGLPTCPTGYECSPGSFLPCFPEGTKECGSDCNWGSCTASEEEEEEAPANCGDGTCDTAGGETNANCEADCSDVCGDGLCNIETGENISCSQDCTDPDDCCLNNNGCASETAFTCPGACCCCPSGQTCKMPDTIWVCGVGD